MLYFVGGNQRGNNRFVKSGRSRWSVPNANVPSEIKHPEQVRKMRQQKAGRIDRFNQKQTKGNKFHEGKGKGKGKGKGMGMGKGKGKGKGKGMDKGKGKGKGKGQGRR